MKQATSGSITNFDPILRKRAIELLNKMKERERKCNINYEQVDKKTILVKYK